MSAYAQPTHLTEMVSMPPSIRKHFSGEFSAYSTSSFSSGVISGEVKWLAWACWDKYNKYSVIRSIQNRNVREIFVQTILVLNMHPISYGPYAFYVYIFGIWNIFVALFLHFCLYCMIFKIEQAFSAFFAFLRFFLFLQKRHMGVYIYTVCF